MVLVAGSNTDPAAMPKEKSSFIVGMNYFVNYFRLIV